MKNVYSRYSDSRRHTFEAITDYLKTFSKSVKKYKNMSLKDKVLFGGWLSIAAKAYRHYTIMGEKNLSCRFED